MTVKRLDLITSPACYLGDLPKRYFDTPTSLVAAVIDTNGHRPVGATSQDHERTELSGDRNAVGLLPALTTEADTDLGYQVSVTVSGFLSGGFVINWADTFDGPGVHQSPLFEAYRDPTCQALLQLEIAESPVDRAPRPGAGDLAFPAQSASRATR